MALCDILVSFSLIFFLWPQWNFWCPKSVESFTANFDGQFYVAMPHLFGGFKYLLHFVYALQSFGWFASFSWWFMIVVNLWQILQRSYRLIADLYVHIFVWGISFLFVINQYIFQTPHFVYFSNDNNHPDWIVMVFSKSATMYIFSMIFLFYMMSGVMLVIRTFTTDGLHPLRARMAIFIGLTVALTLPMFIEMMLGLNKYMTLSIACLGMSNAVVWMTSSKFQHFWRNPNRRVQHSTGPSFNFFRRCIFKVRYRKPFQQPQSLRTDFSSIASIQVATEPTSLQSTSWSREETIDDSYHDFYYYYLAFEKGLSSSFNTTKLHLEPIALDVCIIGE